MKHLFAIVCATVASLSAQVTPLVTSSAPEPLVHKLVGVTHVQTSDPRVSALMNTLDVKATGPIGGYIVLNGPKEAVAAAEEVLRKMDVQKPDPDVEVTAWLIVDSRSVDGLQPLPAALASTAKQLNAVFGYSNLQLLTTIVLRTHPGDTSSTDGAVSYESGGKPVRINYNFRLRNVGRVSDTPASPMYRFSELRLMAQTPGGGVSQINTDVEVREGQKVVIGKTSVAYEQQMPLMVVISAHAVTE